MVISILYFFVMYVMLYYQVICLWKTLSHGGRNLKIYEIYLAKMAKYQKDAAGFIEFSNSGAKYEKKF